MNIADMIRSAATHVHTMEMSSAKKVQWQRATQKAREEHTAKAVERYRVVMQGCGWLTQSAIEHKLGYAATVSTAFLKKLHEKLGLIERRNRNNAPTYARRSGYEWKWKE